MEAVNFLRFTMRVRIFKDEWVEMKRSAMQRIERCKKENLCVACMESLEGEKRVLRGCHERCHSATMRAIAKGVVTEELRVADGKLLERSPGGRKPCNAVTVELRSE